MRPEFVKCIEIIEAAYENESNWIKFSIASGDYRLYIENNIPIQFEHDGRCDYCDRCDLTQWNINCEFLSECMEAIYERLKSQPNIRLRLLLKR